MSLQVVNETRMKMRYGVNQADQCWDFAIGPERAFIAQQLRKIDTKMIRLFLFDKGAPDPVTDWPMFASYIQAVLDSGAVPMITFAKLRRPLDDTRAIRWFAEQCGEVAWNCIEQWGPQRVRNWYWCVWNEPNNAWISGPVTFEQYKRIYEATAREVVRWLGPHLNGRKPLIGGPSVEGFQPFWMDWIWRFVNEIDNSLIGFLDWHAYGEWREHGENNAPTDPKGHRALLMGLVNDYGIRARTIGQILEGRGILNICGELNCHSHYTMEPRERFNHSVFGATYYVAALLHLMRAGVDQEMFWTGTEDKGGYGMMRKHGEPRPSFHAKTLCVRAVHYGDLITFPTGHGARNGIDVVVACGDGGRTSALVVHQQERRARYDLSSISGALSGCRTLLKIDEGTGDGIVSAPLNGAIEFEGFGVAMLTTEAGEGV